MQISIADFKLFEQCVTFDITYKTNKHHLSLGLFYGKNHHKSSVIFGAAFLSKENIESFVWVFERFNECMGRAPVTIITDHDPTMKAALNNVFPRTFHRLCKWYITDKMEDKIGNVYGNKASMSEFYDLLNNSKSIIEFERRWDVWIVE